MGNTFKKFLRNKNTVTLLGIIAGVLVLYFSYNYRVKKAIEPISVPVAKVEIEATKEVTADMIKYVKLPSSYLSKNPNIIRNASQIIGKRITTGTTVPVNGLFYSSQVVSADELPDAAFSNIPDGYTIYALHVDTGKTYGNTIYPGNYIDLYLKAKNDEGKLIYSKLISSIKVLDVKDASGNHVFKDSKASSTPAYMLFAVQDDMYLLLKKAELLRGNDIEILPVPRNKDYTANPGDTEISSQYLQNFILNKTYPLPE